LLRIVKSRQDHIKSSKVAKIIKQLSKVAKIIKSRRKWQKPLKIVKNRRWASSDVAWLEIFGPVFP